MIENLKHHGTVFNLADDNTEDMLSADVGVGLNVTEAPESRSDLTFEEED